MKTRPQATWTSGLVTIMYDEESDRAIERSECHLHIELPIRYVEAAQQVDYAVARIEARGPSAYVVISVGSTHSPTRLVLDVAGRRGINGLRAMAGMGLVKLLLSDVAHASSVGVEVASLQVIGLEACLLLAEAMPPLPAEEFDRVVAELREEAAEEDPERKAPWVQSVPAFPGLIECGLFCH